MFKFTQSALAGLFLGVSATAVGSQVQTASPESFASENAILDTSLLFAIGAQEARQELRGAFGWPTFQEGLVDGVYFRFDPDGYARFSPNPRLDTDVFEVVCRPRTYSCMGRKGSLSYMLNQRGELQLRLESAAEGDRFFVVEGISELEVPSRILQPLDDRMETLLSSSDELIIRRGENEIDRVSLIGFGAVSAYLRWISARQDYTVLPRGWPIPNGAEGTMSNNLTQVSNWQSPMPQPQAPVQFDATAVDTEMAEVRGELSVLRELLMEREQAGTTIQTPPAPIASASAFPDPTESARIAELERNAEALKAELEMLRAAAAPIMPEPTVAAPVTSAAPYFPEGTMAIGTMPAPNAIPPATGSMDTMKDPVSLASRLEYLMSEIGLDAKTALMIIEMGAETELSPTDEATPATIAETYQTQIMNEIMAELQKTAPEDPVDSVAVAIEESPAVAPMPTMAPQDYVLLTDYFKSVFQQPQMNP